MVLKENYLTMSKNKKVESIEELKKICFDHIGEFYIQLNFGIISKKLIGYNSKSTMFDIKNCIDDSTQVLTEEELFTLSNIGKAISKGVFYEVIEEE